MHFSLWANISLTGFCAQLKTLFSFQHRLPQRFVTLLLSVKKKKKIYAHLTKPQCGPEQKETANKTLVVVSQTRETDGRKCMCVFLS